MTLTDPLANLKRLVGKAVRVRYVNDETGEPRAAWFPCEVESAAEASIRVKGFDDFGLPTGHSKRLELSRAYAEPAMPHRRVRHTLEVIVLCNPELRIKDAALAKRRKGTA